MSAATRLWVAIEVIGGQALALAGVLVVAIAAVRRGALTLAVANVIGGNTSDALIVGIADVAYRDGSIYHRTTEDHLLLIGLAVSITTLVVMGLLRRQRRGPGNFGVESVAVLRLYVGSAVLLVV